MTTLSRALPLGRRLRSLYYIAKHGFGKGLSPLFLHFSQSGASPAEKPLFSWIFVVSQPFLWYDRYNIGPFPPCAGPDLLRIAKYGAAAWGFIAVVFPFLLVYNAHDTNYSADFKKQFYIF
jgi:hypothetical protein